MGTGLEWMAAAAVAGTAYSIYNGEQTSKAQAEATAQEEASAKKTATEQEEATNKANQASPDSTAALDSAEKDAKAGGGSTMLTGATGVSSNSLTLGKQTLLGS